MVGGDAFAGVQIDVGKAQRQAVEVQGRARLGKAAVTEFDAVGVDVQAPAAGARAAADHGTRRVGRALPDQVGGVDAGHIVGTAGAIDRRRGDHQVAQPRFAGQGVISIQRGAAVEVEAVAGRELQGLQSRCTELGIALQQTVKQCLGQREACRPLIRGFCGGERSGAAKVDRTDPQVEVTRAVAHLIAQCKRGVGQSDDTAFGIQPGLPTARAGATGADADAPTNLATNARRRDHIEQAVGHRQHVGDLVDKTVTGVVARVASTDSVDRSALLNDDRAGLTDQEHFRRSQRRAFTQHNVAAGAVHPIHQRDEVARLAIRDAGHAPDDQARCPQCIEAVSPQGDPCKTLGRRPICAHYFNATTGRVDYRYRTAITFLRRTEAANTLE